MPAGHAASSLNISIEAAASLAPSEAGLVELSDVRPPHLDAPPSSPAPSLPLRQSCDAEGGGSRDEQIGQRDPFHPVSGFRRCAHAIACLSECLWRLPTATSGPRPHVCLLPVIDFGEEGVPWKQGQPEHDQQIQAIKVTFSTGNCIESRKKAIKCNIIIWLFTRQGLLNRFRTGLGLGWICSDFMPTSPSESEGPPC